MKVEVDFLKNRIQTLESRVLQQSVEQMISKEFDKLNKCKCGPKTEKEGHNESEIVETSQGQPDKQGLPQNQDPKLISQIKSNKQTKTVEYGQNKRKLEDEKPNQEKKRRKNSISKNTEDKIKSKLNATKKRTLLEKKAQKKKKLVARSKSKNIEIMSGTKDDLGGQIININILKKEKCKKLVEKAKGAAPDKKKKRLKRKNSCKKTLENGKSVYSCKKCDFKAKTYYEMSKHTGTEHEGNKWFCCDNCAYKTIFKHNLATHKRNMHRSHQATSSHG